MQSFVSLAELGPALANYLDVTRRDTRLREFELDNISRLVGCKEKASQSLN
jgi:hypothetical protein